MFISPEGEVVFTIENFVDVVNEVLIQVGKNEESYQKIQDTLLLYLKGEMDFDSFGFEFTMLMIEAIKGIEVAETVRKQPV